MKYSRFGSLLKLAEAFMDETLDSRGGTLSYLPSVAEPKRK